MNFATAPEFYDFCVDHKACEEGLVEIKGLTLAEWWDKTNRGDWMLWLRDEGVWDFTPVQLAEYERIEAQALAEYERTTASALAEYMRIEAPAWAEYERITAQAWAEYFRITARTWAEYKRIEAQALAEYERIKAPAIREIIGNPFKV